MDELDRELKKTIGFKPNLDYIDPESITFIQHLGETRGRSEWITKACNFYYNHEHYKAGFLITLIQENFELCKHILRKIGRAKSL